MMLRNKQQLASRRNCTSGPSVIAPFENFKISHEGGRDPVWIAKKRAKKWISRMLVGHFHSVPDFSSCLSSSPRRSLLF